MTAYMPYKKILISLLAALILLPLLAINSQAQQNDTQSSVGNIGIQISAPVYNFGIDPSGTAQDIIKVKNVSDTTQTFYPEVFDFKPIGETGAPQFILNKESENYTYSLASWIKVSKEAMTLKPNESTAINFTISVPKGAEPGGRYAGILFGTSPPQTSGTQIAISNKVGSLILVRVSGAAKEAASLEEYSTPNSFYEYLPAAFLVRVKNSGNVHVVPKGTIEIKNIFGQTVATLDVNEKNGNVLPDSIRKFDKDNDGLVWGPSGLTIGYFTANLLLTYGEGTSKQITGSLSFWVLPWKLLLIVLLALVIILLLIVWLIKRYNRWVVAKAEKGSGQQNNPPSQNSPPAQ